MADTGAPYNIPFLDGSEIVRDYPQLSEDLADKIVEGLDAAGGLVAVKHVLKTDTFTASVSSGDNVAVDDLSITHEVADANNRLIITAYFGAAANSLQRANVGIAVAEDDGSSVTLLGIGAAEGSRTRVAAGGVVVINATGNTSGVVVSFPSITFVHTPGAGEKIYTVRAINPNEVTRTLYINRSETDGNSVNDTRTASALVIQEVKV